MEASPSNQFSLQRALQNCMHGGTRNKWSLWQCTDATLASLALECDGNHEHEAWGLVRSSGQWGFATALECEYPTSLCNSVAQLILSRAVSQGATPLPVQLGDAGLSHDQLVKSSRAVSGKLPRGRKLPQLVSEYKEVRRCSTSELELLPEHKVLRKWTEMGKNGQNVDVFMVGIFRTPEEFLTEAKLKRHPMDMDSHISDLLKTAVFKVSELGPSNLMLTRTAFLRQMMTKAEELKASESLLHQSLDLGVAAILKGKKLLLFKWALEKLDYGDKSLFQDICDGFRITGKTNSSDMFPKRLRPATNTDAYLRGSAKWKQKMIAGELRATEDPILDKKIWDLCMDEQAQGWIDGNYLASLARKPCAILCVPQSGVYYGQQRACGELNHTDQFV